MHYSQFMNNLVKIPTTKKSLFCFTLSVASQFCSHNVNMIEDFLCKGDNVIYNYVTLRNDVFILYNL